MKENKNVVIDDVVDNSLSGDVIQAVKKTKQIPAKDKLQASLTMISILMATCGSSSLEEITDSLENELLDDGEYENLVVQAWDRYNIDPLNNDSDDEIIEKIIRRDGIITKYTIYVAYAATSSLQVASNLLDITTKKGIYVGDYNNVINEINDEKSWNNIKTNIISLFYESNEDINSFISKMISFVNKKGEV